MPINKELLRETLQTIKDNPQHWDQTQWHCGSSHCFAGFVECKIRGADITEKFDEDQTLRWSTADAESLISLLNLGEKDANKLRNDYVYHKNTALVARFALGLNEDQADILFDSDNELEDLEIIIEELCTQDQESAD
jgi:hypothetical protein